MKIFLLSLSLASITLASTLTPIENSLVVYNGGVGLVHEKSTLKLKKKDNEIIYRGVANTINTDSVNLNLPKDVKLFSQQYRYDKLTLHKLLDAHIEKKVYLGKKKVTLLSHSGNFSLVKKSNGDITQVKNQDIIFKKIPSSLLTKPSLIWNVESTRDIDAKIELDYLINNISWMSNYILYIDKDRANLSGFITIDNRSGKSYKNTKLFTLAGDLNSIRQVRPNKRYARTMAINESPTVAHNAHGGYHLYSVPFKVNLANNEKTQIKFIDVKNIKVKKTYVASLIAPINQRGTTKHNVAQMIEIKNLDIPLPKGVIRSYSKFEDTNILLGESRIKHTPKKTKVDVKLGFDFDTKVDATLEESSSSKHVYISKINYLVTNNSNEDKMIKLHIPFSNINNSEIKTEQKYTFINANLVEFIIDSKANTSEQFNAKFITKR